MNLRYYFPLLIISLWSCKPSPVGKYGGFPEEIGEILVGSCATSGCHTDASASTAGGLSLESWESMFEGSSGGSSVIPFRSDQSFLDFFINTDTNMGVVLSPTMPFNSTPLTSSEVLLIREWIDGGAKNIFGLAKFEDNPYRKKFYVVNQGCDQMSVFDFETGLIMRQVDIGIEPSKIESPHILKISKDQQFLYMVFLVENPYIEKYSTLDESLVARIEIGYGDWNTIAITDDGKFGFAVDLSGSKVAVANLETHSSLGSISLNENPHGSYISPDQSKLYLTKQYGNGLHVLDISNPEFPELLDPVDLLQGILPSGSGALEPHEVFFSPTGEIYFVSCQKSNEVRVFSAENDSLIKLITVGDYPLEFASSPSKNLLFVTCTEDTTYTNPGERGSIAIINYTSLELVKHIHTGHQPHGIDVDESTSRLYIAHRNKTPDGPAPHHSTDCGGRNGYVTILDLLTLELVPGYKQEVSVDPYSLQVKQAL